MTVLKKICDTAGGLLQEIVTYSGIFEFEEMANDIKVVKIKVPSYDATDNFVHNEDIYTNCKRIDVPATKSEVCNAPILLNGGKATNFIYKVTGIAIEQAQKISGVNTIEEIRDILKAIKDFGGFISYTNMENQLFKHNLIMIDSSMPQIIANMLLYYYAEDIKECDELVKIIGENDPIEYGDPKLYERKFKKFLCSCALGMKTAKKWEGMYEDKGGYNIVKSDGAVRVYHVCNRNYFEQYLLNNTIFESPLINKSEYMNIYEENGQLFIKFNLQIGFK